MGHEGREGTLRGGAAGGLKAATARIALALLLAALVAPVAALGAPKPVNGFIGGSAGVNTGGLFTQPRDVAVYTGSDANPANDKIFVAEGQNNNSRIQRLDRDGNFELAWGRDTVATGAAGDTGSGYEICSAAVSGAEGCKSAPAGTAPGEFDDPGAVAVNQATGAVYVFDRDNERVQQFTLDGEFVRAWGDEGTGAGQLGATEFVQRVGIAVSPVAPHDVFVTDPANRRVLQFEADGTFVRGWGHGVADGDDAFQVCEASCQAGNSSGSADRFADMRPADVAVDADGIVYASDATDGERVVRFDSDLAATPAAALLEPLPSPGLLTAGVTVGLEVDPATGNLLVGRDPGDDTLVQEIADPGAGLGDAQPPTVVDTHVFDESPNVGGIGFSSTDGHIYLPITVFGAPAGPFEFDGECELQAGNPICAGLMVLAAGTTPTIDSAGSTAVGSTTAELAATMDVQGGVGRYRFEVSTDGVDWQPVATGYLAGAGTRSVSATATGLQPATLYRLRLTLSKQSGISTFQLVTSEESTFVTEPAPPDVQTLGSSNRTATTAQLRARVDPNGLETAYRFEWGLAGGPFDRSVPIPDASVGAGNAPLLVVQSLAGLQPGTAYQYRVVASNSIGEAVGQTVVFETRAADGVSAHPRRGYELVSPPDKVGGVGVGFWYEGPGAIGFAGEAAHDVERFAALGQLGSVLTDGEFAWANDWALADRTPQGWVSEPVATRRGHGTQYKAFLTMSGAAPDLSLMSWTSNSHSVTLFEQMEGWDDDQVGAVLLLRDWAGAWEVFGTTEPGQNTASADGPIAVAANGSLVAAQGRGLGGPGDPSSDVSGLSVFVDDVSAGLSDTFPGAGVRRAANVCTAGTLVPASEDVGGDIKQSAQPCPAPAPGRYARIIGDQGATLEARPGAVSDDGRRVFFTSGGTTSCSGTGAGTACPAQLYVRQGAPGSGASLVRWISRTAVTAAAGASEDQDASLMAPVSFEGASADGDKVFFRTTAPLTADDPNGQGVAPPAGGIVAGSAQTDSSDLFMYDMADGADPAGGTLTRISAGPTAGGDCNSGDTNAGALRFVSDDGARVYFTCAAPLPGVAVPNDGTITEPAGTPGSTDYSNLYLYDARQTGDRRWRFIARLPRDSELGPCATTGTGQDTQLAPAAAGNPVVQLSGTHNNCVSGTADGALITLWTDGRLTADDPDEVTGDIYAYDAVADDLVRVSAARGGVGGTYQCAPGDVSTVQCHGDPGIGDPDPGPLPRLGVGSGVDGVPVVFFESRSRLLATDTDAAYDVYEWRAGELRLVSTGASGTDGAFYVGNDRVGRNVYLATRDQLTWQDNDAVLDVYTARVDGGIPQPPAPPVCGVLADGCQGPGAPPTRSPGLDSGAPVPDGNVPSRRRVALKIAAVSRKAARRAARRGVLVLPLRVSGAATVRVVARASVGGRLRRVAAGRKRATRAGVVRVRLRLSRPARRKLAAGRRLSVRVSATADGGRPALRTVNLRGGAR